MRKVSENEFSKILIERGLDIKILKFVSMTEKADLHCNKCGHDWSTKPSLLTRKTKPTNCPVCSGKLINYEKILERLPGSIELCNRVNSVHDIGEFKCSVCSHEWKTKVSNIINNHTGCPNCVNINKRKDLEWFKEKLDLVHGTNEFSILSEYHNFGTKIKVRHNICGHEYETTPNNIIGSKNRKGRFCPNCSHGSVLKTSEEFNKELQEKRNNEYELVDEYKGNKKKIILKHIKCQKEFEAWPNNFLYLGAECPYCSNRSVPQSEISSWLKSLGIDIKDNYKLPNKKEIDIFIPSLMIGFEFDGLYWHSESIVGRHYQEDKTKAAKANGIILYHIFEDEWREHKEIVQSKIISILKVENKRKKIYARKCNIKEIDTKDKNNFLNKNHIQGADNSNLNLGLFFNDELVSVMTFVKKRNGIGHYKEGTVELSRFATKIDSIVYGAFPKLLKYFISKNTEFERIISYADLRWSNPDSNIYLKNNFSVYSKNKSSYWYFKNYERFHRYSFRKDKIKERFPEIYDKNLTEFEMMDKTSYKRIWDCGTIAYELKLNLKQKLS